MFALKKGVSALETFVQCLGVFALEKGVFASDDLVVVVVAARDE